MRVLNVAVLLAAGAASASAQVQRPLEASLRRGAFEALFSVGEPAYVAVFEAIPGQGIQQLFPRSTMQASRPVEPGEYLLSRPFRTPFTGSGWTYGQPYARPMWMLDATGRIVGYYYTTGWNGTYGLSQRMAYAPMRTLLLVASRFPLRQVASPDAAQHWLQRAVGFRTLTFSVAPSQSTLDDIVAAIIPTGAGVDDVVVDVLDIVGYDDEWSRFASNSISLRCPGGAMYSMRAEFFFESGDFWCPTPRVAVTETPTPPAPPTTLPTPPTEGIKGFRRVPTKSDAAIEEGVRVLPRGMGSTPLSPSVRSPMEEGVRMYDGRRGGGVELPSQSTVLIGGRPNVEGATLRGVGEVRGAYIPPGAPVQEIWRGRQVPEGRYGGGAAGASGTMSAGFSSASGSSSSTAAGVLSTPATSASTAQAAQAAQAARSAESRATINADRAAATGKVPPGN